MRQTSAAVADLRLENGSAIAGIALVFAAMGRWCLRSPKAAPTKHDLREASASGIATLPLARALASAVLPHARQEPKCLGNMQEMTFL